MFFTTIEITLAVSILKTQQLTNEYSINHVDSNVNSFSLYIKHSRGMTSENLLGFLSQLITSASNLALQLSKSKQRFTELATNDKKYSTYASYVKKHVFLRYQENHPHLASIRVYPTLYE